MFWAIWLACAHVDAVTAAVGTPDCSGAGAPADLLPLIGAWKAADTSAIFRVCMANGALTVDGWDGGDMEPFVVSKVSFQRGELRFTSLMPSTNWSVDNVYRKEAGRWVDVRGADPGVPIEKISASPP